VQDPNNLGFGVAAERMNSIAEFSPPGERNPTSIRKSSELSPGHIAAGGHSMVEDYGCPLPAKRFRI
jgi:hypothetical protein